MLASQPVIGRMIALATRYDVSAHVASSIVTDRLSAMWGSDTFTTVVSSTSMKVANITLTAISHGLMARCSVTVQVTVQKDEVQSTKYKVRSTKYEVRTIRT